MAGIRNSCLPKKVMKFMIDVLVSLIKGLITSKVLLSRSSFFRRKTRRTIKMKEIREIKNTPSITTISADNKASPAQNFFTPVDNRLNMGKILQRVCEE